MSGGWGLKKKLFFSKNVTPKITPETQKIAKKFDISWKVWMLKSKFRYRRNYVMYILLLVITKSKFARISVSVYQYPTTAQRIFHVITSSSCKYSQDFVEKLKFGSARWTIIEKYCTIIAVNTIFYAWPIIWICQFPSTYFLNNAG